MTSQQWEALKYLFRALVRMRIDTVLMSSMLLRCQLDQKPPQDWHGDLLRLRQLPAHQQSLAELETLLSQVEKDMRESEINQLLRNFPIPPDWVN